MNVVRQAFVAFAVSALAAAFCAMSVPASAQPAASGAADRDATVSGDPVTRAIERRQPAHPLSAAERVDARALSPEDLDRLARESRARWSGSGHGPMLARILPEVLLPTQLPQPDSIGARLTGLYCVQCHNLPNPAMHEAQDWARIVRRMVPRMEGRGNLGPLMAEMMRGPGRTARQLAAPDRDEEREIVRYLQRNGQREIDASARPELAASLDTPSGTVYRRTCGQCHVLPDPQRHTADEWPRVVQRMQRNMQWMNRVSVSNVADETSERTTAEILRFLRRHARR